MSGRVINSRLRHQASQSFGLAFPKRSRGARAGAEFWSRRDLWFYDRVSDAQPARSRRAADAPQVVAFARYVSGAPGRFCCRIDVVSAVSTFPSRGLFV